MDILVPIWSSPTGCRYHTVSLKHILTSIYMMVCYWITNFTTRNWIKQYNGLDPLLPDYHFPINFAATISFLSDSRRQQKFLWWKCNMQNGKAHKIKMISGHNVMRLSVLAFSYMKKKNNLDSCTKMSPSDFFSPWCHGNSMIQKCKCTLCELHVVIFSSFSRSRFFPSSVFTHKSWSFW